MSPVTFLDMVILSADHFPKSYKYMFNVILTIYLCAFSIGKSTDFTPRLGKLIRPYLIVGVSNFWIVTDTDTTF